MSIPKLQELNLGDMVEIAEKELRRLYPYVPHSSILELDLMPGVRARLRCNICGSYNICDGMAPDPIHHVLEHRNELEVVQRDLTAPKLIEMQLEFNKQYALMQFYYPPVHTELPFCSDTTWTFSYGGIFAEHTGAVIAGFDSTVKCTLCDFTVKYWLNNNCELPIGSGILNVMEYIKACEQHINQHFQSVISGLFKAKNE